MTPLIQNLVGATVPVVLLVVALFFMIGVVLFHASRTQRMIAEADDLYGLAIDGRSDEARIRARKSGRAMKAMLDVLGGEVAAPPRRAMVREAPWIVAIALPVAVFVSHGLRSFGDDGETRIRAATAMLLGTALLLPSAFACSIAVFEVSRRATRAVRGACVALLAQNVKAAIDNEKKDAVRRGPKKDPRGD